MTSQSETRIRGRLLLLLPLAAWMAASFFLITRTPADSSLGSYGAWLSGDHRSGIFYDEVSRTDPDRNTIAVRTIDLTTGESASVDVPDGQMLAAAVDKDWNVYLLHHPLDETASALKPDSTELVFLDFSTGQVRISPIKAAPDAEYMRLVAERYLVFLSETSVQVLDTRRTPHGFRSARVRPNSQYIVSLKGSKRFLVTEAMQTGQVAKTGTTYKVDLFEIDDEGQPKSIASWPAGVINRWTEVDCDERFVYSISPDLTQIEVRAVADGYLVKTISVPGVKSFRGRDVSLAYQTVPLHDARGEHDYFDLVTQQWLPNAGNGYRLYKISPDRRYIYFTKEPTPQFQFRVYDREKGEFVSEYFMSRRGESFKLDDQIVILSRRYGYSAQILDFKTGTTIRQFRPLMRIVYWLLALMILYVVWAVAWMLVSHLEGGWAWTDVLLVVGMPALVMILRTGLRGDTLDLTRPPTRLALGGVMAAEMLAVTWIVFGKTRWSLRIVPLIVLTSLLMMLFTFVFGEKPWLVWHATKCALVPAVCLIPLLLVLRLARWRLEKESSQSLQSGRLGKEVGRGRFPLRDLILITVVAAVWFSAARPAREAVGEFFFVNTDLFVPLAVAVGGGLIALLLGLNRHRGLFLIGVGLAIGAVIFITWATLAEFAGGNYSGRNIDLLQIHPPIVCAVALLVALTPYRLRGWRIERGLE